MFDVAVIGGGPAGLAGALALVRARMEVVLLDCWPPRNAAATEVHGFVTQDGTPPLEMRRAARAELARYPTFQVRDDERVLAIGGASGRFVIQTTAGVITARRVLLSVGLVDELPAVPGYRELWGTTIFQCPHCHAWEVKGRAFGYFAPNAQCAEWSLLLRAWTRDLIVFTGGAFDVPDAVAGDLVGARIRVETRPVVALHPAGQGLVEVELADGERILRQAIFARPPQRQTALVDALTRELGLALAARDRVHTTAQQETSVPGIYAAGDLACHEHGALAAAAAGARAAHALGDGLVRELVLTGQR